MVLPNKFRIAFKTISALLAGIFLFQQIAWAGDLINTALEQQYKDQSQTFAPSYLQNQQSAAESIVSQKQAIEDTLNTQNLTNSTNTQPPKEESLDLKGPKGGGQPTNNAPMQRVGSQSNSSSQDSAILSVTTQAGDIINYENNEIYSIKKKDGTIIQDITLDQFGNLSRAQITHPDGTIQIVCDGKTFQIVKTDGAVYNYNSDGLIDSVLYPDNTTAAYSYTKDEQGNILETIVTDNEKVSYYDSSNKLEKVVFNNGKSIEYDNGILSKAVGADGATYYYTQNTQEDGSVTASLSQIESQGALITSFKLDKNGHITDGKVQYSDNSYMVIENGKVTEYYDNASGSKLSYLYNADNSCDVTIDKFGVSTNYKYTKDPVTENITITTVTPNGNNLDIYTDNDDGKLHYTVTNPSGTQIFEQGLWTGAYNDYAYSPDILMSTLDNVANSIGYPLRGHTTNSLYSIYSFLSQNYPNGITFFGAPDRSNAGWWIMYELYVQGTMINVKDEGFEIRSTGPFSYDRNYAIQHSSYQISLISCYGVTSQDTITLNQGALLSFPDGTKDVFSGNTIDAIANLTLPDSNDAYFDTITYNSDRTINNIVKPSGDIISYQDGLVDRILSGASQGATTYSYDLTSNNDINQITVDSGGIKQIYDQYGNLSTIDADGVSMAFDNGQVSQITKEDGTIIQNATFDANNNIVGATITNPGGVKAIYNSGVVNEVDQPDGSKLYYDANGNITSSVSSAGISYSYAKDVEGGATYLIAIADNADAITDTNAIIYQKFDSSNTLLQAEKKDGTIINYTYAKDGSGKILNTYANDDKSITTYDANNNITTVEVLPTADDPVPTISNYEYNQIRTVYKGNTLIYNYTYETDANGNQVTAIQDVSAGDVKRYENGVFVSDTDTNNVVTSYQYNSDGKVSQAIVTNLGQVINTYTYTYSGDNTIIQDIDGIIRTYDKNNKLIQLEQNGQTYQYTYQAQADGTVATIQDLVSVKDDAGVITNYLHGNIQSITEPDGTVITDVVITNGNVTNYTVKQNGLTYFIVNDKLSKEVKPDGTIIDYNASGLAISATDQSGKITQYSYVYSGSNQLQYIIATKDGLQYKYDKDGTFIETIDGNNNQYYYDSSNELVKTTATNLQEFDLSYSNNIISIYSTGIIKQNLASDLVNFSTNNLSVDASNNNLQIKLDRNYNFDFGNGSDGDLRVEAGQTVTIDGTKNYSSIYVAPGGVLTASPWNGTTGGDLEIKCTGSIDIEGTIKVDAEGYRGGSGRTVLSSNQYGGLTRSMQGESFIGNNGYSGSSNYGGGGGGGYAWFAGRSLSATGAGGSYGTAGVNGTGGGRLPTTGNGAYTVSAACAGSVYGDPALSTIYMGSGGGAGYQGTSGGSGGGIIKLIGNSIDIKGMVSSNGGDGSGGAGGGSGGSIWIEGKNISVEGSVSAVGGSGSARGGDGRIRVDYGTFTGNMPTSTPYMVQMSYDSQGIIISSPMAITSTEFGHISANTNIPTGTNVVFMTRTGASSNLNDGTWSNWITATNDGSGYKINSPVNNYLQCEALFTTTDTSKTPSIYSNGDYAIKLDYSYNKSFDATAPPQDVPFKNFLNLNPNLPIIPNLSNLTTTFTQITPVVESSILSNDTVIESQTSKTDATTQVTLNISKDSKITTIINDKPVSVYQQYTDGHMTLLTTYGYDANGDLVSVQLPYARDQLAEQVTQTKDQVAQGSAAYLANLAQQSGLATSQIQAQFAAAFNQIATERAQLEPQLYQEVTKSKWVGWWIFGWWETYTETVEVSQVRDALNQLDEQERQLNIQESDAYAQLNSQIQSAENTLNANETTALTAIENQQATVETQIINEETSPVIINYYREILGRDPSDAELAQWVSTVSYNSTIDVGALKTALTNSAERTQDLAFIASIKGSISDALYAYVNADTAGKQSILSSLGLSLSDAVTLNKKSDADAVLSLLDQQNIHFGRSAFVSLQTLLSANNINTNVNDLAQKTILIDIFTGAFNSLTEGNLLELSMRSLSKTASLYGLTTYNTKLNYADLTQAFNSGGTLIAHLKNDHYVDVTNIASDGAITYVEHNKGQNGSTYTVSEKDFENSWTGYVITKVAPVDPTKILTDAQAMRIKGSCLFFLAPLIGLLIGAISGVVTAAVAAITVVVSSISAILAPVISSIGALFTGIGTFMEGIGTAIFSTISFVGNSLLPTIGTFFTNIGSFVMSGLSSFGSAVGNAIGFSNLSSLGITLGKTIVTTALSIGLSKGLDAIGLNPVVSNLLSSFVTGGVSGLFNNFSAMGFIGGGFQGLAIQSVGVVGQQLGIDPNISSVIGIAAGSLINAGLNGVWEPVFDENGVQIRSDFVTGLDAVNYSMNATVLPSVAGALAYSGVTELGNILGVDPRISYLAGIGIRSSLQTGLSSDMDPGAMWNSVTTGLLQGVTNIGINYATQELGLNPLLANLGFSAIAGAINAGIQAATGGSQDIFKSIFETYEKNALTFLGYSDPNTPLSAWQQAAYMAQVLDFSSIVQKKGLVESLNTYGAGFLNAIAVNQIVQVGCTIGNYVHATLLVNSSIRRGIGPLFPPKPNFNLRTLPDGTVVDVVPVRDSQGNVITNIFFKYRQNVPTTLDADIVGKEDFFGGNTYLSWGNLGVDAYGKLGYTDAQLYSTFNSDTQYQRIENGQQTYAEIKDLQGNTLIVIEPTANGSYNVYNSYGDYVDAKISNVLSGDTYSFTSALLNKYQGFDSTNTTSLFDVDFSNPDTIKLMFNNIPLSMSDINMLNNLTTQDKQQMLNILLFPGIGNPEPIGVSPAYMKAFAQKLTWADPGAVNNTFIATYEDSPGWTGKAQNIISWIGDAYFGTNEITNYITSEINLQFSNNPPANMTWVAYSGSGDPSIKSANANPGWDVTSIVLVDAPTAFERKITNPNLNNVIMIAADGDPLSIQGLISQGFDTNPKPLNVYKIVLNGVSHTDFATQNPNNPTAMEAIKFTAYVTTLANNKPELENFLNTAEGITRDPISKLYEVNLKKVAYGK